VTVHTKTQRDVTVMSAKRVTHFDQKGWALAQMAGVISVSLTLLAGCASQSLSKPGVVHQTIQREIDEASKSAAPKVATPSAIENSLLPSLQMEGQKKSGPARFDISVSNAPAAQVFMAIVDGTPYSMLVPPDVTGNLSLSLKNVTVQEVLDTVRDLYGYDYRLDGNRIFIQPNTLQNRMFSVNYLSGQRRGSTNVSLTPTSITGTSSSGSSTTPQVAGQATQPPGNTASGGSISTGGSSVTTTQDADFWRDLRVNLEAIIGSSAGCGVANSACIVLSPSSGMVMVRAMPTDLRSVERYLRTIQGVVGRQVMLEAKIIEVQLSDAYQSGVNWATFNGRNNRSVTGAMSPGSELSADAATPLFSGGTLAAPGKAVGGIVSGLAGGFYGLAFQSDNFAAMMSFLETQGSTHVLSSPRVATLNNQKAVLKVGNDEYFVTNVSTTTTSGTGATTTSPTVTLQPFFSGIALDVTPQIDENEHIILHVHPSISKVYEKSKRIDLGSGGTLTLPLATSDVNESDTIVRVRDSTIVAIGGLMRHRQEGDRSGLPGTSAQEFTLLGQRARSMTKSEVVILIKPTIIRDDADWRAGLLETQARLQEYAPSKPVQIHGK
jgi:MSHA biogenesis protein MshL